MKRVFAMLLVCLMLLSLTACGGKDVIRNGVLEIGGMDGLRAHDREKHPEPYTEGEIVVYNNLSTALLDLESGKIDYLGVEKSTADYTIARSDKLTFGTSRTKTNYAMMTLDTNKEVYDILNNAIKDMKEDGTLDRLVENELNAYINSDPAVRELPVFENAETIYIGVTGDVPPMDFVASNGKAAGFNVALLTEIANRAKVNFELIQIETGARPMALSTNKVDAVFWTKSITCTECNETWSEEIQGTIATEVYYSADSGALSRSSAK